MAFMERNLAFCNKQGYSALIIFPTWMFLASYEKLRKILLVKIQLSIWYIQGGEFLDQILVQQHLF